MPASVILVDMALRAEEQQNSSTHETEQTAVSGEHSVTAEEVLRLRDVLTAAREYIAAVKQQQKGGVGRAWAQLVKAVRACEDESST
jgi:hypothetical protein